MKLRRQNAGEGTEPILPLIDVVFFLLVFFMLVGRMDATSPFAIVPPLGMTGADMPAGGILISVDRNGELAVDDARIAPDDLLARLTTRLEAEPELPVRINADAAGDLRTVLQLVGRVEAAGAMDIALVVSPAPQ